MYTPLKVTTDYSLLQSLIKIDDLILFLVEHKINTCGICDDNLFGCMEFYFKCQEKKIKPLIGLSLKFNNYDLYLYAKDYEGLKNLFKIHEIKQQKEIEVVDLVKYSHNILAIIPYASKTLKMVLSFYEDIYHGYQNKEEKNLLNEEKKVYVNDLKVLKKEDVSYLNYLDLLAERDQKSYQDNYYDFNEQDDAIAKELIAKINLEIPLNEKYIPEFVPNAQMFLRNLCAKGLAKRLNNKVPLVYQKRLDYELNIIEKMDFCQYFLIVYDYVLYAKKHNILVNCRGSAAASLVSYVIGITSIDPIEYNLIFERFLNPERITMPDIDIDFATDKREEVISYVKEKYGSDKVAKGITFVTLKAKLVLRDLAKVLKIDNFLIEKFMPNIKTSLSLSENLKQNVVKKYLQNYQELKKLYHVALKLEDLKKNISTHASAVVISSKPLNEIIPTLNNGELITGTTDYLEACGLLKMDFLGLKNLSFIKDVLNLIHKNSLPNLDYNDPKVFAIFNNIDIEGIFQFETPAMRHFLTNFKIDTFKDLVAALALIRPGPKDYILTYNRRKKGLEKISYIHPDLESILSETYGIILYQEQIMAILRKFAGFSYGEADIIRRAIAKKKESILAEEKTNFINRAVKKHYDEKTATLIYEDILKFADYGFNKSHSVSYAKFSYDMAYLKAYYYEYFVLALLNRAPRNEYPRYFNLLRQKGLKIAKPSIRNLSFDFIIKNGYVYLPLTILNKVNKEIILKLKATKEEGYQDYFDFITKTHEFLNRETLEILIKAGALDCFKLNHLTMLNNIDRIYNYLDLIDKENITLEKPALKIEKDYSKEQMRQEEKEVYGFYLVNHPTSIYQNKNIIKVNQVARFLYKNINLVLLITKITKIKTKKNEEMAFLEAEDETGSINLTVFPRNYFLLKDLKIGDVVFLKGEVTKRFDKVQIIVKIMKKDGEIHE